MAVRTSAVAVQGLLLDRYGKTISGTLPDLTPFMQTASKVVDRVVICAARKNITLDSEEKELMERWLAAHAYAMSDRPFDANSTRGSSATYSGKTAMRLEATTFGQMALSLDPSGCLEAISRGAIATGMWLGKRPSEQIDAIDRE